jgi:hypothetical protein
MRGIHYETPSSSSLFSSFDLVSYVKKKGKVAINSSSLSFLKDSAVAATLEEIPQLTVDMQHMSNPHHLPHPAYLPSHLSHNSRDEAQNGGGCGQQRISKCLMSLIITQLTHITAT